jgi:hypothetical protein
MRLIICSVFDLKPRVRSIVCCAFDRTAFDREACDRSQITALKSHNASVTPRELINL